MKIKTAILIILVWVIFPFLAFGQTADNLVLSISPENPDPETLVTATVSTFSFDLERSRISWRLNGRLINEGTGIKSFNFQTGKSGSKTIISAIVTPPGGVKIEKSLTIQPVDGDILFQAINSYKPPFYRGRTLPTKESEIRTVVIPNGTIGGQILKASDFVYTWKKNSALASDASGFGKNSFTFKNRLIDDTENIQVDMSEMKNRLRLTEEISIPLAEPRIVFYEKDPALGVNYTRALAGNFPLTKDETIIAAAPLFFSLNGAGNNLKYKWFFNDELIPGQTAPELAIRKPAGRGQTKVSVEIEKPQTLFQKADASIILSY